MKPDYPLLGLLARKPASGYDLGKWLRAEGLFLGRSASMTPIYRALGHLLDLGWVDATVDPREAAPDAKVYRLTEEGRTALVEWAETPYHPARRPMSPDFIVRLNFAGQLGPEHALRIVQTELAYRRDQRAAEGTPVLHATDLEPVPEIDPQWLTFLDTQTHARGWQSTSLFLGWLETMESQLLERVREAMLS